MSKIWFLKEGEIQVGPPRAQKTVGWCVENLGLRSDNWLAGPEQTGLTVGQKTSLGEYKDFRYAVVEVDDDDIRAGSVGWKVGYYLLDMNARDVQGVLDNVP